MRHFKLDLLSPYVSDVVAFLVLGASIAAVFGVASIKAVVREPSNYQSFSYVGLNAPQV